MTVAGGNRSYHEAVTGDCDMGQHSVLDSMLV